MIHLLQPAPGSRRPRKRVGRGNSSGHGSYSTRGVKGQRARTGRKRIVRRSVRGQVLRIPKRRGFTSQTRPPVAVDLATISRAFPSGAAVGPHALLKAGLIGTTRYGVAVIGSGPLRHPLKVRAHRFSRAAHAAIEAAGGTAEQAHRTT
jgi:large subunit ribosomal protein L15